MHSKPSSSTNDKKILTPITADNLKATIQYLIDLRIRLDISIKHKKPYQIALFHIHHRKSDPFYHTIKDMINKVDDCILSLNVLKCEMRKRERIDTHELLRERLKAYEHLFPSKEMRQEQLADESPRPRLPSFPYASDEEPFPSINYDSDGQIEDFATPKKDDSDNNSNSNSDSDSNSKDNKI